MLALPALTGPPRCSVSTLCGGTRAAVCRGNIFAKRVFNRNPASVCLSGSNPSSRATQFHFFEAVHISAPPCNMTALQRQPIVNDTPRMQISSLAMAACGGCRSGKEIGAPEDTFASSHAISCASRLLDLLPPTPLAFPSASASSSLGSGVAPLVPPSTPPPPPQAPP